MCSTQVESLTVLRDIEATVLILLNCLIYKSFELIPHLESEFFISCNIALSAKRGKIDPVFYFGLLLFKGFEK